MFTERKCTTKSDVWSFGVLLWEMYSSGRMPYPDIEWKDILGFLENRCRLGQPSSCPDHVYQLMMTTWKPKPDERPTFSEIADKLDSFM